MNSILEAVGLNKSYHRFALRDISFSLPEGCIIGFIGINGAGKTTTIRSLLGLTPKNSGTVKIFGLDTDTHEREIKERLEVVLGDDCFYGGLSMDEMKSIIAPAYANWQEQDYTMYMEQFDLDPAQKISTLSKGMKAKFALALALSHQAELLIMDEPTDGLDPLMRKQLLEIMKNFMKTDGRSVFFSTHITSDLDKMADMLVLINNGKIIFQENKDELLERHRLVKGDRASLNPQSKDFFLHLDITDYGFSGITNCVDKVRRVIPDVLIERVTIEDIMLAHVEREKDHVELS